MTNARTALRSFAVVMALAVAALVVPGAGGAAASPSPAAVSTAAWLAAQIEPDGSVINPYTSTPSVDWSVNVALALAPAGTQPVALGRAMGYIRSHITDYVTGGTSDVAGRLAWLILLAHTTGDDPFAFGTPATDLVALLQARYGVDDPHVYGLVDDYTPVTNQSLALLALHVVGVAPPSDAVQWLVDQQCTTPSQSDGGWQGYRAPVGLGIAPCRTAGAGALTAPEVNSTSMAIQALLALGVTAPIPSAIGWLHGVQVSGGMAPGGFGQCPGDDSDPNSTAVVLQALAAAGVDQSTWNVGGATPLDSLTTWEVVSGPNAGALASPWSSGEPDLYATYQGEWGLLLAALPFPYTPPVPSTTTSTTTEPSAPMAPAITG